MCSLINRLCNARLSLLRRGDREITKLRQLELLLLAERLKDGSNLREVMQTSSRLVLDSTAFDTLMDELKKSELYVPSKTAISRARFVFDAAWMMWHRVNNYIAALLSRTGLGHARYLGWDSSDQYGKDYVMALVRSIPRQHIPRMLSSMHRFTSSWAAIQADTEVTDEVKKLKEGEAE